MYFRLGFPRRKN